MAWKRHPLNCLPDIVGSAFEALVEDIQERGILQEVVIADGMVLDGWNRVRAAEAAGPGVEVPTRNFDGSDPIGFLRSMNLHRRHALSKKQLAEWGASLATAKRGQPKKEIGQSGPFLSPITAQQAAEVTGASVRQIKQAKAEARKAAEPSPEPPNPVSEPPDPVDETICFGQEAFAEAIKAVREAKKACGWLCTHPWGAWLRPQELDKPLNDMVSYLKGATPAERCSECDGKRKSSCKACRGSGFFPKSVADAPRPKKTGRS